MAMMTVNSFSGVNGNHKNAIYAPDNAIIQEICNHVPIARRTYDHPLVIIHAMPKHSKNLGFSMNCKIILIFVFMGIALSVSVTKHTHAVLQLIFGLKFHVTLMA